MSIPIWLLLLAVIGGGLLVAFTYHAITWPIEKLSEISRKQDELLRAGEVDEVEWQQLLADVKAVKETVEATKAP